MGIAFQGLDGQAESSGTIPAGMPRMAALERSALLARVSRSLESARDLGRYQRLGGLVLGSLDRRLDALETAVARFSWPVTGAGSGGGDTGARLVTGAGADAKSLLRAELRSGADVDRYYKYFSRGRSAGTDSGLDGRDYAFTVTQGGTEETIEVAVPEGETWGQILDRVAEAVNASSLPVQAEVVRQTAPGQALDFLSKTGAVLALTVAPGHRDQDVELADTEGRLLDGLQLEATSAPLGAPATAPHAVSRISPARAGNYRSDMADPESVPDLAAGTHKLLLGVGGEEVAVEISVTEGMTWENLLQHVAERVRSTDSRFSARVVEGRTASGLPDPAFTRAVGLELALASPKRGQRLSVGEYGGPWLEDVDGFHDPTNGLPNWVTGGERYVATATANGWTEGGIYAYDGTDWTETLPVEGGAVHDADGGQDWFYDGASWSAQAAGDLAHVLGLNATAAPGADAAAHVDGRDLVSETGTFSLDQGRLAVEALGLAGASLPLRVAEGYAAARDRFLDVVEAYNELMDLLLPNEPLFEDGFVAALRAPVADLEADLGGLGVEEVASTGKLWVRAETFWKALVADPGGVRSTLADAGGLLPELSAAMAGARGASLADGLARPQALADSGPSPAVEAGLEKRSLLQEVVDAATTAPRPEQSPYLEFTNLLSGLIRDKRDALAATSATGGLFKADA